MSTSHLIMWGIVLAVGFFFAGRSLTALALVIAWAAGEWWWIQTGDNLPVKFYLFPDIFVISLIGVKRERTIADRVVLLIFPVMWVIYVASIGDTYRYQALYYLALAQFLVASYDPLILLRHQRMAADIEDNPSPDAEYKVAWGWVRDG